MTETVFTKVDYTLGSLMDSIELGTIGLPDIQRPFVWRNAKVRNLFDSMYRGYPVGYLLFWENANTETARSIGDDNKQKVPSLLIVDGQQRLTSLYAVIKGIEVLRQNYTSELIEIAFNPLTEKFEVADAAIRRDKSFIPNISAIWASGADIFEIVDTYLDGLQSVRELSQDEIKHVRKSFTKLQGLLSFPFTSLTLAAHIDEEQVSEVFVRINSEGKKLNQADFILTLMSVFWDDGRSELERFCRDARTPSTGQASPFNYLIHPDPDQLLRVSVGLGFKRGRLKSVYSILRGKDVETDELSQEHRDEQFAILKDAQQRALDLQYWHDFLKAILASGYRSYQIISSQNNLLFAYILYLMGRTEFGVDEYQLRGLVARWFFMSALTGRYTGSPESRMESDLARFRGLNNSDEFTTVLADVCNAALTSDFWEITLPNELATSAARSPSLFAYFAALNLLDARVLFSKQKVSELMDPSTKSKRASLERHHLFPKAYLNKQGITDSRDTNQIANYAMVEWGDNGTIGAQPPSEYLPPLKERFSGKELERMYYWHALPDGWETLEYSDFLRKRRELMSKVIRDAYARLSGEQNESELAPVPLEQILDQGETTTVEFKSTLRTNLHTQEKDSRMETAVLKTIAAFLNTAGGNLIIGVSDDGSAVGIDVDGFANEDKMYLHLINLIKSRIGTTHMLYIQPRFDDFDGVRVLAVDCSPSKSPVFVKEGNTEFFYVRTGAATAALPASQTQDFINQRFGAL